MSSQLVEKIRAASRATIRRDVSRPSEQPSEPIRALTETTNKVIAIGASTGGTEALKAVLTKLPPIRRASLSSSTCRPTSRRPLPNGLTGCARSASRKRRTMIPSFLERTDRPGNYHMLLRRSGARYYVEVKTGPMVHHQRPAVDVLFKATAKYAGQTPSASSLREWGPTAPKV